MKTLAMATRFPGVDYELQKILDANMDHVHARRLARESFKDIQLGIDHILFKVCSWWLVRFDSMLNTISY